MALEERLKVPHRHRSALRDLDRLEELPEAEEVDALPLVLVSVREIERRRVLGEERRLRDVEHVAGERAELGQRQRRLPAPCAAHHDERRRQAMDLLLAVVERERLVEDVELGARPEVADRLRHGVDRLGRRLGGLRGLRLVDARAPKEARTIVGMLLDHLEGEARLLTAVADELHDQPAVVVEPRAKERALVDQLLHVGAAEVVALDRAPDLFERRREAARHLQIGVREETHRPFALAHPAAEDEARARLVRRLASARRLARGAHELSAASPQPQRGRRRTPTSRSKGARIFESVLIVGFPMPRSSSMRMRGLTPTRRA